jgi:hypothetical protein
MKYNVEVDGVSSDTSIDVRVDLSKYGTVDIDKEKGFARFFESIFNQPIDFDKHNTVKWYDAGTIGKRKINLMLKYKFHLYADKSGKWESIM